jgi:hypothetical protein
MTYMTVSGTPAIDLCDPSKSAIRRDLEEALLHGPMEVDDKGRINFYATSSRSSLRRLLDRMVAVGLGVSHR